LSFWLSAWPWSAQLHKIAKASFDERKMAAAAADMGMLAMCIAGGFMMWDKKQRVRVAGAAPARPCPAPP
jgi:hypothetical protein